MTKNNFMTTQDKKHPSLNDDDPMPLGKYKGTKLEDVPAKTLEWFWEQDWLEAKYPALYNYIFNNKEALEEELGHEI